jgi:gliding motility-associated lipoprotein GldH
MRGKAIYLGVSALLLLLSACSDDALFEENRSFEKGIWNKDDAAQFLVDIQDTVSRYDLFINMRNGDAYPYMNAFLFVKMEFPNGRSSIDTVECFLSDQSGQWLGSGLGDVYDNRFLFKKGRTFPIPGTYRIEIRQAMRTDDLPEIYDVGLRIAPAKP